MIGSRIRFVGRRVIVLAAVIVVFGYDAPNNSAEASNAPGSENVTREGEKISHPPEGYSVSVESQEVDNYRLLLELTSNIPGTIEVMAGISLSGQAPGDTWIGKNERVRLNGGTGKVIFDVSDLPAGEYDVEATFYLRWGFQDKESRLSGVDERLEHKHSISISGSGEPAEQAAQRNENQKWVMENVVMGTEWDPDFWKDRFGDWQDVPVTTRNPDIISNYYFESLDMTLVVNTVKDEIVVWRIGRGGLSAVKDWDVQV